MLAIIYEITIFFYGSKHQRCYLRMRIQLVSGVRSNRGTHWSYSMGWQHLQQRTCVRRVVRQSKHGFELFQRRIAAIVRRETKREPTLFIRDGGLLSRINSKGFVEWLGKKGVPSGEAKTNSGIPNFIVKNRSLLTCCIRGVFDTDGSVYFDMHPAYSRPSPRIDFAHDKSCAFETSRQID